MTENAAFTGQESVRELKIEARQENLDAILEVLDEELEKLDCPRHVKVQLHVAVEEIFVNIAHYAYPEGTGEAGIRITAEHRPGDEPPVLSVCFTDEGIPFNPLEKEDPDVTLSGAEREIGGLGIYMVKKRMDEVTYEWKDGKNQLTIRKTIAEPSQ